MNTPIHNELKKEFQLERMILFSDAVFAIAITLLAIEIKVPELNRHTATDEQLGYELGELIPKFIGFFVSFFIIGLYWTIHHRMFGFVVNYTSRLLWLNLIFLLAVVLMPFSTAFYSVYIIRLLNTPVIIYVVNIVFLGVMNFILWLYMTHPKRHLVEGLSKEEKKYFSIRAITVPIVFIVIALVYLFISPHVAIWVPPVIPLLMRILRWRYRNLQSKKAKSD
jgi:uncharacterized membrane protein